jgi:hypothetical protein
MTVAWNGFGNSPSDVVNPILQALGLDVIGAAIPLAGCGSGRARRRGAAAGAAR